MFTHILGFTQRKDVSFAMTCFVVMTAQVDWCIDQKMEAEDIYLSLSRNIQNVCLGQRNKNRRFLGVFFFTTKFRSVFFLGIVFGVKERGIEK